jgi:hypothetical protein
VPTGLDDLLDKQTKRILSSVLEYTQSASLEVSRNLAVTLAQLASRFENCDDVEHHLTRKVILKGTGGNTANGELPEVGVTNNIKFLSIPKTEEDELRSTVEEKILQSLRYQSMSSRYDTVAVAYQKTFQ